MSESRGSFFRQSAWLATATVVAGAFMTAVHPVASEMGRAQYEVFGTMLRVFLLLGIPSAGLQTSFAQQTASALTQEGRGRLATTTRRVLGGIAVLWLLMVIATFVGRDAISTHLKLGDGRVLWPTLGIGLMWLVVPVLRGLLQGEQDFATLGWVSILDGTLRLSLMLVAVLVLHLAAAGGLTAAFLAMTLSTAVAFWRTRTIWSGPASPFEWWPWLARVLPFTLGAGAMLVLANVDLIYLKAVIPESRADEFGLGQNYQPASMIGFAMVQFTVPIAMVMFPKIVRSTASGGKSDALALALIGTLVLGAIAAGMATLFPRLPLQIVYFRTPANVAAAPMVPWCAWAMLAFALANVLVSNLLAQGRFTIVPWTVLVVAGFLGTLAWMAPLLLQREPFAAFRLVTTVIAGFNLLLLGIAALLTWGGRRVISPAI